MRSTNEKETAESRDARTHSHEIERLSAIATTIVSVPLTVEWSPPYAVRYGGIGIASTLGPRLFVALEELNSGKVELGSVRYVKPEVDEIVDLVPDRHHGLQAAIRRALKAHQVAVNVRIHIFSEYPFFRGLAADSGVAAALSSALHLYQEKIEVGDLDLLSRRSARKLLQEPHFREINHLAWGLESAIASYRPDGHHTVAMFLRSTEPVVFTRMSSAYDEQQPDLLENPETLAPQAWRLSDLVVNPGEAEPKALDSEEKRVGVETEDVVGDPDDEEGIQARRGNPIASLDAALIFVGREADSQDVYLAHRRSHRDRVKKRYGATMEAFQRGGLTADPKKAPRFANIARSNNPDPQVESPADAMMDLPVVQSVMTFQSLQQVAEGGMSGDSLRDFAMEVGKAQDIYRLLQLSSGYMDEACHVVRIVAKRLTRQKIAVRLVGPGRAGCLLVLGAWGSLEYALPAILREVRQTMNEQEARLTHTHWFSGREGYSPNGQGLRVDQHRPKKYLDSGRGKTVEVTEWRFGEVQAVRLLTTFEWGVLRQELDLVLEADGSHPRAPRALYAKRPTDGSSTPEHVREEISDECESPDQLLHVLDILLSSAPPRTRSQAIDGNDLVQTLRRVGYTGQFTTTFFRTKLLKYAEKIASLKKFAPIKLMETSLRTSSKTTDFQLAISPLGSARIAVARHRLPLPNAAGNNA